MIDVEIVGLDAFDIECSYDAEIVAEAIKSDIEMNLELARSYDGSVIAPLKPKYAARKIKVLGHARIFDGFREGDAKLKNSIKMREINKDYYEVYVGNNNSDIMTYLQEGERPMNGPRRGFGISEQSIKRIGRQLNEAVKIVKRGQRA